MELRDLLAIRLRALMDARPDLDTQTKISRRTGVSQSTVQRVLAKEVHTNLDVLATLAHAFGVTPESLIAPLESAKPADLLTPSYDEIELLAAWRRLTEVQRHQIMGFIGVSSAGSAEAPQHAKITAHSAKAIPGHLKAATDRAAARPRGHTEVRASHGTEKKQNRARGK